MGIFGITKVRTELGFVLVRRGRVLWRWVNYLRLWRRLYARQRFAEARQSLARQGLALPDEAAPRWTGRWCVERVRLGSVTRRQFSQLGGGSIPLGETMLVKYLQSRDPAILDEYERLHVRFGIFTAAELPAWRQRTLATFESVLDKGYDPAQGVIVLREDGTIADGYHRAAALWVREGGDLEITVVRILGNDRYEGLN